MFSLSPQFVSICRFCIDNKVGGKERDIHVLVLLQCLAPKFEIGEAMNTDDVSCVQCSPGLMNVSRNLIQAAWDKLYVKLIYWDFPISIVIGLNYKISSRRNHCW